MALTTGAAVVFALIAVVVVLFVTEAIPTDTTAIGIVVTLAALERFTNVTPEMALSGFSSPATITIVAMYVLSGAIASTGVVQRLGDHVASFTGYDRRRVLLATVGITGPLAGVVNNTPVVAVFVPMVRDLAERTHVSPSKLLIPLSYAAMLGGTLTLVGTSTNLVASDLSGRLIGRPFTMFEFTHLGLVVLVVGSVYLLTVGQRLLPERVHPLDLTEKFDMHPYLWRTFVRESSPMVGQTVEEAVGDHAFDLDVLQVIRGDESFVAPGLDQDIVARDRLTVRADEATARAFADDCDLRLLPRAPVTEAELDRPGRRSRLVEVLVPPGSELIGDTVADSRFRDRYRSTVLSVRRGSDLVHEELANLTIREGDGLLLHATRKTVELLDERDELVVVEVSGPPADGEPAETEKAPLALAILAGVIAAAALGLVPIAIAALGGVVAMVATDVIHPGEAYDAVDWEVIFLLAGVIPLGLALQSTGGADLLAGAVGDAAVVLPAVAVLGLFYLVTGLLANLITPVASVALLVPIAVDTAARIDANAFAFVLAVTFAGSTAFMTPVGYQTNLMVYSPGGYRFTDYVRVGAPLQLLLAVVTTLGIAVFWGV